MWYLPIHSKLNAQSIKKITDSVNKQLAPQIKEGFQRIMGTE